MKLINLKRLSLILNRDNLLVFLGTMYLFLSMHPVFLWSIPATAFYFALFLLIVPLVPVENYRNVKGNRVIQLLMAIVFVGYIVSPLFGREFLWARIFHFLSFFIFFLLSDKILYDIFKLWKKVLIFFSLYALVVFVFFTLGFDLPHTIIENAEKIPVGIRDKNFFRVYGLVVSSTNTLWQVGDLLVMRLCGPFAEPGHFGIFIGFTMLIDRFIGSKTNFILLVTGILTFSPAFLILLFIIESHRFIIDKRINIKFYITLLILISAIAWYKGSEVLDRLYYIAIERHEDINKRTVDRTRMAFNTFSKTPKVFVGVGREKYKTYKGAVSDTRGMIFRYGVIAVILSTLLIFLLSSTINTKYALFLFGAVAMVFAHRVWMFEYPYIYTFMILASSSIKIKGIPQKIG